jgi:hypothetical protein
VLALPAAALFLPGGAKVHERHNFAHFRHSSRYFSLISGKYAKKLREYPL